MGRPRIGYYTAAGERVPSVTEILGRFKNPEPLISWAFRIGRDSGWNAAKGLPSVRSAYEEKTQAGQAGNIAHDLIENYIFRQRDPAIAVYVYDGPKLADSVMPKALKAFDNAKRWLHNSRLEVVDTEVSLVSERYGFGGTRDVRFRDPAGLNHLGDWKSSRSIYADYLMQLAAYAILSEECEGIVYDGGYDIMQFSKDSADFTHKYYMELEDAKKVFLLMAQAYPLAEKLESRVR